MKETTTYTFKYGSDNDNIDLNTLLLSQIHFSAILNEIKNDIAADANLSIKIRPLTRGSVPFDLILNVSWIESILSHTNAVLDVAAAIIGIYVSIIQLRKWSKGKGFTEVIFKGDKAIVKIGDREFEVNKISYELYVKNPVIDAALSKAIEAIDKDENITDVEIIDNNKTSLVKIERAEFIDFIEPNELFEANITVSESQENLVINRLAFEKGYKWQFYLSGRKISATMADDAFMGSINAGEKFAKGDILVAVIESEKIFDKSVDIYIEKDFKIIKVLQHIPRNEQARIEFPIDNL